MKTKHKGKQIAATVAACVTSLMLSAAAECEGLEPLGVETGAGLVTDIECKCYSDGEAVRYILPAGERRIVREMTQWRLPDDAVIWFQGADSRGNADYEAPYESCKVGELAEGRFLALPITARLNDGTYRMLTEANVVDYTDLGVRYQGGGVFAADFYADKGGFEMDGVAATTPWRVMIEAKDLATLYSSDMVRRLCPDAPPDVAKGVKERFAKPGRSIWHWLPAGAPKFEEQRDWYDKTVALGFEYYLIDEGWRKWGDETTRWQRLRECIDYGRSVGVGTFIWVDSKELRDASARREYLAKAKDAGAVGVKIDFMPAPSHKTMRWYEETLADAFAAGLLVDFHGAVKPSGRERTWPHEIAREAIRGHEYHVTRYRRVLPLEHDTIVPFCRLVQGPGDYTPMVFEKSQLIHFTWAHQLAQGIVFACPFLCFGDFPRNYIENPAADAIRAMPAVYDETRLLDGSEIGECIAVARRKGSEWFIAVENGAHERTLQIPLDFIDGAMDAQLFGDSPDRLDAYSAERRSVKRGDVLTATLRAGGGFVAWLKPAAFAPTWESLAGRATPAWFENARFGIFCHWGMQCAAEDGDWYARCLYDTRHWQGKHHRERFGDPADFGAKDLANAWKGENWEPDALCALYKRMGAQYILAMANHHDNFDNWDSTHQPWNSVNMGPRRDVLGEWSAAARRNGMRFGASFHASHAWTWLEVSRDYDGLLTKEDGKGKWWDGYDPQDLYCQNHEPSPDYKNLGLIHRRWAWGHGASMPSREYMEKFRLRTMDAIAKYKPDVIYFDDTVLPFHPISDTGLRIAADFYNANPDGVVEGKCLDESQRQAMVWDVERGSPPGIVRPKWQMDTCIGDWHYDRARLRKGYKSATLVLRILADVISKNGVLCLSVPIRSDGTIDDLERAVCEEIAAWMAVNSEAVFSARPYITCGEGPQIENAPAIRHQGFNEGAYSKATSADVRFMANDDAVYAFVSDWPADGKVVLKTFASGGLGGNEMFASASLLGCGDVPMRKTDDGLELTLPGQRPKTLPFVLKLQRNCGIVEL